MSKRRVFLCCGLLLILLISARANAQVAYVSVQSGAWTNPNTWAPWGIPGALDSAVISAGHTVGLAAPGARARVTVGSLVVYGTLTAHFPAGRGGSRMSVYTTALLNIGTIQGERGRRTRGGGSILLSTLRGPGGTPLPGVFWNVGTVQGGNGSRFGGNVSVFYPNGRAINIGKIQGGTGRRGGFVRVWATIAFNGNRDRIRGLWGGRGRGRNGRGGNAILVASTLPVGGNASATNGINSLVRGGRGTRWRPGPGGSAAVVAVGVPFPPPGSPALNDTAAMIRGGDGCPGGGAFLFGTPTINRGTVRVGNNICPPPPRPPVRVEPPEGTIEGGTEIFGDFVELSAGSLLTIGDLNEPNAISAVNDIVITLAPGGRLDLRNNIAGENWFSAGGDIVIYADDVNLDPGVDLNDIMEASNIERYYEGAQYSLLDISPPDANFGVEPNETVELSVVVSNLGNMQDYVSYSASDTEGWMSSVAGANDINAMGADTLQLTIQVPPDANEGDETIITVDANTSDTNATSEIVLTVIEEISSLADNPFPADDAQNVSPEGIILSWTPEPEGEYRYTIYFGIDDNNMTELISQTDANSFELPDQDMGEYYLWRVDVNDVSETYEGNIWGFETVSGTYCEPSLPGDINGDCETNFKDLAIVANSWLECDLLPESHCP